MSGVGCHCTFSVKFIVYGSTLFLSYAPKFSVYGQSVYPSWLSMPPQFGPLYLLCPVIPFSVVCSAVLIVPGSELGFTQFSEPAVFSSGLSRSEEHTSELQS